MVLELHINSGFKPAEYHSRTSRNRLSSDSAYSTSTTFVVEPEKLQRHDHQAGKYHNAGVFKPSGSARYNYLVQKFKHRKELKELSSEPHAVELKVIQKQLGRKRSDSAAGASSIAQWVMNVEE